MYARCVKMKISRSSRFFVVLLHLLGVSRRRRYSEWLLSMSSTRPRSGILGVQPLPMLMEQIELSSASPSSTALEIGKSYDAWHYLQQPTRSDSPISTTSKLEEPKSHITSNSLDPIWLQSTIDSKRDAIVETRGAIASSTSTLCLGPTGSFSDCGDATLWTLRPMQFIDQKARRRKLVSQLLEFLWLVPAENRRRNKRSQSDATPTIGWSFEVVDTHYDYIQKDSITPESLTGKATKGSFKWRRLFQRKAKALDTANRECLQYSSHLKTVAVQKCSSRDHRPRMNPILQFLNRKTNAGTTEQTIENGFVWIINQDGLLQAAQSTLPEDLRSRRPQNRQTTDTNEATTPLCLGRNDQTMEAILVPCSLEESSSEMSSLKVSSESDRRPNSDLDQIHKRPVRFTFFRYLAVPVTLTAATDTSMKMSDNQHSNEVFDESRCSHKDIPKDGSRAQRCTDSKLHRKTVKAVIAGAMPHYVEEPRTREVRERSREKVDRKSIISSKSSDVASVRSNGNAVHPGLTLSKRINFQDFKGDSLRNTNAILFVSASSNSSRKNSQDMFQSRRSKTKDKITNGHDNKEQRRQRITEKQPFGSSVKITRSSTTEKNNPKTSLTAGKLHHNRIYRNPYIDASTNNIWKDPSTGLEYHTDLCQYLRWNCQERRDRHTITGVGVYRKGYVIKVYGIAFYVSKRDILANPNMVQYADKTADELRQESSFYGYLRTMNQHDQFDRTILIKTNMQLSTETMRSSLQADWSYLTSEMKTTLVGASMKSYPANQDMLEIIRNAESNPARCSCSQTAPAEYDANPECCARGTELAFTWLKSDTLEVRLNGRLMESFPRPDIAAGIFYEYLRYDDPIAPELRDRVVDGFPFLLSPLIQAQGNSNIVIGNQSPESVASKKKSTSGTYFNPFALIFRSWGRAMEVINDHTTGLAHAAKTMVAEPVGNVVKSLLYGGKATIQSVGEKREWFEWLVVETPRALIGLIQRDKETMRSFADVGKYMMKEADQSREWLLNTIISIPSALVKFVQQDPKELKSLSDVFTSVVPFLSYHDDDAQTTESRMEWDDTLSLNKQRQIHPRLQFEQLYIHPVITAPSLRCTGNNGYTLHALDEISPMVVNPTTDLTRLIFLSLVHLYLLLMFIVSFPGSYSTKTKMITSKKYTMSSTLSDDSVSETMSQYDRSSSWNDDDMTDVLLGSVEYSQNWEKYDTTLHPSLAASSRFTEQHNLVTRRVLPRRSSINKIKTLINRSVACNDIIQTDRSRKDGISSSRQRNKLKSFSKREVRGLI